MQKIHVDCEKISADELAKEVGALSGKDLELNIEKYVRNLLKLFDGNYPFTYFGAEVDFGGYVECCKYWLKSNSKSMTLWMAFWFDSDDYYSQEFINLTDISSTVLSKISASKITAYYLYMFFLLNYYALKSFSRTPNRKYDKRELPTGEPLNKTKISLHKGVEVFFDDSADSALRNYTRRTEAWDVRGHYRHYKNGKTVFINGYSKGKGDKIQTLFTI